MHFSLNSPVHVTSGKQTRLNSEHLNTCHRMNHKSLRDVNRRWALIGSSVSLSLVCGLWSNQWRCSQTAFLSVCTYVEALLILCSANSSVHQPAVALLTELVYVV